ncbi:hypothetical protein IV203_031414 [Nitzschia inconspicua]|uniref:Uncharacterized protein n=1 Tax=Nitzschia inconspicua TaxID=303405 RepID=A0A9K3LY05_9STRA|nr:hypothetical protein IV203_031414 [Nitzschia inconspicua]
MWGDKIKATKPGDPSRVTYRQRMSQAENINIEATSTSPKTKDQPETKPKPTIQTNALSAETEDSSSLLCSSSSSGGGSSRTTKPVSSLSVGEDLYLGDLMQQKYDRDLVRQEKLMDDAVEMYRAAVAEGAPESEALCLQFLKELKETRIDKYREEDKVQDELVVKE